VVVAEIERVGRDVARTSGRGPESILQLEQARRWAEEIETDVVGCRWRLTIGN
jgi:hypothetical protein